MRGIIVVNAHTHYEELDYQPKRLKEEFDKLNVDVNIVDNCSFLSFVEDNKMQSKIKDVQFCVYLDKDINTALAIEKAGVRCFNCADSISITDSKALTYINLVNCDIPLIKTLFGAKIYNEKEQLKKEYINSIQEQLNYPFVAKIDKSSQGMGVALIKNEEELVEFLNKNKTKELIFQEYLQESFGEDIRVIAINNKVLGAMRRVNKKDFRSNVTNGGESYVYVADEKLIKLSEKITKLLHLDYAGLDFLKTKDGYVLCEVNSNAFFKAFEKTCDVNVAQVYAKYIYTTIK